MTDERWARVWELFSSARDVSATERSALLNSSSLDPEIRSEVMALLEVSVSCTVRQPSSATPLAADPEYAAGHELGRYVIIGLIGQGGFGRIYAARDKDLRRVVALKVLSGPLIGDSQRLIEEARAASALNHPNIVTVYETISAGDHLAIVMEFVDGQSLRQVLHSAPGPLPLDRVLRYGGQIAQALAAAHEAGIAHRDVKPENILVRRDEYVKLVDFGLAADLLTAAPDASSTLGAGTLRYMPPEQLRGERTSPASDVFSLGLILYEMATGAHPFPGKSALDTAGAIARGHLVAPSQRVRSIPPRLDSLILMMLAKSPDARPSATEVARTLAEIAGAAHRPWLPWVLGALVACLAAVALFLPRWTSKPPALALRLDTRPLTGDDGWETKPALSPDGRFVVYSRQERPDSKPTTLVREIGTDRKTMLSITGPFNWLPDNVRLGFLRAQNGIDTLCVISRDGRGEEEILKAISILHFEWSPGGEWIVYAARPAEGAAHALFLYSTRTRGTRQLTFPPATARGDEQFAVSPDGKQVAFRRTLGFGNSYIFLMDLPAPGPLRQLAFHQTAGDSLAWLRDGSAVVSSFFRGSNYSLWLHPIQSPEHSTRLTEVGMEALSIQSARARNRLLWVNSLDDTNIWSVPANGGKPVRVISSAMRDVDVASSSRGLLAFRSDRSGFPEIWISGPNGESQTKVTNFESFTGSPRWSPDGRRLAFDSRRKDAASDVYVADCDPAQLKCSAPVQATDHSAADALPNWSSDGSHLYFASQRSGQWQSWRTRADGNRGEAVPMTTNGGYFATESSDGAWLYYSRIDSEKVTGIWRKHLRGAGSSSFRPDDTGEMVLPLEFRATASWVLTDREIFYYTLGASMRPSGIWALNLKTRRKRMVHAADIPLSRGLALSPEARLVFFVRLDRSESNVMVADYEIAK